VALVNPPRQDHRSFDLGDSFVPVRQIGFGQLNLGLTKPLKETRRHSYVCFRDGDVIIANILSSFQRGKCALASCLVNGYVIWPSPRFNGRFLAYLLQSHHFHSLAHARGGRAKARAARIHR
jgi:hypothetical protein